MEQQHIARPSHTAQYTGVLIMGVIIGASAAFVYFKKAPQSTHILESARQEGFDTAARFINERGFGDTSSTSDSVYVLSGIVTGVQGNRITIHTQSNNPFDDHTLSERTAIVNSDTKIFNTFLKRQSVMQSEMEAFVKAAQADGSGTQILPLEPFTRIPSDIAGVKVGNRISVIAKENIRAVNVFSVMEVQIQQDNLTPINN